MKLFATDFEKATADLGAFFLIDRDEDAGVDIAFRVRRIPDSVGQRFEKKYGREEQIARPAGGKRPQRVFSLDELQGVLTDKADWAWTDTRNVVISIGDEGAADFYTKELGRQDDPVKVGDEVVLDGKLTSAIKRRVFAQDANLMTWILQRSETLDKKYRGEETELSKA